MLDYRLVQTAVIGDKNSDLPVILPMDAHDLDLWRKAHPTYTYWCGLQLDGCGGELSGRRYTSKVCHFAHHPSAPVCRRKANGESSADHLFIKQGMRRLLDRREVRGEVRTRDLGTGPGDAVDVHLVGSHRRLRFQLSTFDYRAWRRAEDELAAEGGGVDWILATDGPVLQQIVSRQGYCLRVRCETAGGERRVHIGAEARDRTVAWAPLEDCSRTSSGIVTPHVERIGLSRSRPEPLTFPIQGGSVFALVPGAAAPVDSPFEEEGRHLLVADVKPMGSPIARTLISLPGDTEAPPAEHVYKVSEGARILLAESAGTWAVLADRYVRLNAHEAQRTGLWTPPSVDGSEAVTVPAPGLPPVRPMRQETVTAPVQTVPSQPTAEAAAAHVPVSHPELAIALREALVQRARLCSPVTWDMLVEAVGPRLAACTTEARISLLLEVDRPLWENVPVLSALIQENGVPLPYLSSVLFQLGVPHSDTSSQIKRWAAVETERAFAVYGLPTRPMPPRYLLRPERPVVPEPEAAVVVRRPAAKSVIKRKRTGRAAIRDTSAVRRVRVLVRELNKLLGGLDRAARGPVIKAVDGANVWLAFQEGAELPLEERRRLAMQTPEFVVDLLEYTLQAAEGGPAPAQRPESHKVEGQRMAESAPPKQHVKPPTPAVQDPVERLTRQLIAVAARGQTVPAALLGGGRKQPGLRSLLEALDGHIPADVPVLSALVLGPDGGPVPFFRDILKAGGLAVPRTDEALLKIWHREQERAHAAYANPPQALPPRLVPPR